MGAPTVTTIRPGVTFTSAAASSFRRVESAWGRRIDVNSTYRDWNKQWSMYVAWNAYTAGRGPYPGHSRAIHPDLSVHCQGRALDSDDWRTPGFNNLMAEYGWIRTAANDPTERHHFEYQSWRDQHVNEPAADTSTPIEPEKKDVTMHQARHPNGAITLIGETSHQPLTFNQYNNNIKAYGEYIQYSDEGYRQQIIDVEFRRQTLLAGINGKSALTIDTTAVADRVKANLTADFDRLSAQIATINAELGAPTVEEIAAAVNDDMAKRLAQ